MMRCRFDWNYPRSRGEKSEQSFDSESQAELPPLARGKARAARPSCVISGITPARAGKSPSFALTLHVRWNYPRSRGEKLSMNWNVVSYLELPPLARGKVVPPDTTLQLAGITPARAGKRTRLPSHESSMRNYPRSRGEKRMLTLGSPRYSELPPLARGKDLRRTGEWRSNGITPARAGKSLIEEHIQTQPRNYPRSRGEKIIQVALQIDRQELPPLARGKVNPVVFKNLSPGITPARAGKSIWNATAISAPWNYPRSRGEKSTISWEAPRSPELPPLARGKASIAFSC